MTNIKKTQGFPAKPTNMPKEADLSRQVSEAADLTGMNAGILPKINGKIAKFLSTMKVSPLKAREIQRKSPSRSMDKTTHLFTKALKDQTTSLPREFWKASETKRVPTK